MQTEPLSSYVCVAGLCKSINVYGIGGAWGRTTPYQYYQFMHTERNNGNPTHSFGAEQALVLNLAHHGVIKMCTNRGCTPTRTPPKGGALDKLQLAEAKNVTRSRH